MSGSRLGCAILFMLTLAACGESTSRPTCLSSDETCTTKEPRYNATAKRFETVEHHWGCASGSGALCNRWLDTDKPENRAVIDTNKRVDDYLHSAAFSCERTSASCGGAPQQ